MTFLFIFIRYENQSDGERKNSGREAYRMLFPNRAYLI